MASSNKERQQNYADKQRAQGRVGRKYWATPKEHDKLKKTLEGLRK